MRVNGEWLACDDGISRPVIRAEVLAAQGAWHAIELLVDTGADLTVLSANVLKLLNLKATKPNHRIGGVGGIADSVALKTQVRLTCDDGRKALFPGEFLACVDSEALDMSVLGQDILEHFALIMDRSVDIVALVRGRHRYTIQP